MIKETREEFTYQFLLKCKSKLKLIGSTGAVLRSLDRGVHCTTLPLYTSPPSVLLRVLKSSHTYINLWVHYVICMSDI